MNSNQILHKSENFELRRKKRRKTDKVYYEISLPLSNRLINDEAFVEGVRDLVDPLRNRSGRYGLHWKYRSREEAEQMLTALLLRWA